MTELRYTSVIDGLRRNAAQQPTSDALLGETHLSYAELYEWASCLAGNLQASDLHRGHRLAIWTPKSAEAIVAIWGALEAGLAYVPLDPAQPGERAARIMAEATPEVLVVSPDLLTHLPGALPESLRLVIFTDVAPGKELPDLAVPTLRMDDLPRLPCRPAEPAPDWIAAVLFTSGSTGIPKGVQLSHRNLDAFIGWAATEFALTADDVIANHAGFHFDLSTFDLFAAARAGAAVWPIPTADQSNIVTISEGIERHGVTTIYAVPSILTMLTRTRRLAPPFAQTLRRVLFAGEVFPIGDLRAMAEQLAPQCVLYNLYGPTETNVCTYHRVRPQDLAADHPLPIGTPLPGQKAIIRDPETLAEMPPGAKGELVIEGTLVTPGYLNLADPKSRANHAAGRHATGDIVSLQDGVLTYHGRIDRIVKINGNRVELGEIEADLASHPHIAQAAIVQISGARGTDLVAFVTPVRDTPALGLMEVLTHLSGLVPRFMLPRHVKVMPELPRTPNGKVDLRHLKRIAEDHFARPAQHPENEPV